VGSSLSRTRVKRKTIKLKFAAFPPSTQHSGVRTKTGWLWIMIMTVPKWHMCTRALLFHGASTIQIQHKSVKADIVIIISWKLFSPWYSWKNYSFGNHSLIIEGGESSRSPRDFTSILMKNLNYIYIIYK
jgi:hypothetical protein